MPLCPQITLTPVTVTSSNMTVTSVIAGGVPATVEKVAVVESELAAVEIAVNGKNKIYRQTTAPTGTLNEGDVWFDTDEGNKQYYWTGTAWVSVQDTAIAAAQAAATAAQATADGKNRIYRQASQPTGGTYVDGDLWFDTDDGNKIYRFTSGSWATAVELGNSAIASLSASKLTAGTIDASVITVSNINAGNISTGTLSADRIAAASITGTKIAAGTITASNIATGTITATQIAAGTITTDKLSAGTLTGFTIQTSSGNDAVIMTAASNSLSFKAGGANRANMVPLNIGGVTYGVLLHAGATPDPSGGTYPQIFISPSNVSMSTASGATGALYSLSQSLGHRFQGQPVTVSTDFTANSQVYMPNINSSSNAANVRWGTLGGGQIFYSTASSERFKEDITDLADVPELDPKMLLTLPVRAFRYKDNHLSVDDDRSGVLVPGFIAEEVDAVYPIATDYEENGPYNWNERFIVPALLALIQDLYKQLDALKGGN